MTEHFDVSIEDDDNLPEETPEDESMALSPSKEDNSRMNMLDASPYLEKLTPKQLKFVHALCESNLNVPKAAKIAGVTRDYGHKLMNHTQVRKAYTALTNQRSWHTVASHNELLEFATSVIRDEQHDEIIDMKASKIRKVKVPTKDKFKYLEVLSKHQGILYDRPSHELLDGRFQTIVVDIEGLEFADAEQYPNVRKDISDDVIDVQN
ncbi:terminase small subunit [Bacillus pseudomycoides]|uniref:terminase small subunit n=1 Tax=Bacillus TaxID=1386 RepID=UPI002248BFBD|nr:MULTISPECIES: terminase small subunit [Bacillus]MCX2826559.1 terminase small subunit [Bacillus sp. DHT2]MDR4914406.1 terminase small subunit [Bacillus pseudomycoides]